MARNGPTAMADLSPLLGEERKSDFGDVRAAVGSSRSYGGSALAIALAVPGVRRPSTMW